jgi:hypothetical protein
MTWTLANLAIQIVAGMIGGNLTAVLAKEHSFGLLGHTVGGAVAGALNGYFLQSAVGTLVTGSGAVNDSTPVEQAILQALAGVAAGAIAILVVGFLKHSIAEHRATRP